MPRVEKPNFESALKFAFEIEGTITLKPHNKLSKQLLDTHLTNRTSEPATSATSQVKVGYSIKEVCQAVSIGRSVVYEQIKSGALVARKFGRRTVILQPDLDAWLSSRSPT